MIVCDDIQNDGHAVSPTLRDQTRRWFHGLLLKAGTRRTDVLRLATALHRDALALELTRTPGWESRDFGAIIRWPERMDLWGAWETLYAAPDDPLAAEKANAFYETHRAELHRGAEVLWPEEEPLEVLMRQRVEGGRAAFEREKQNVPAAVDACEWPDDYFAGEIWFDVWPDALRVRAMAVDPSLGREGRRGDDSAIVLLGIDAQGIVYVEADLRRRPTSALAADVVAWHRGAARRDRRRDERRARIDRRRTAARVRAARLLGRGRHAGRQPDAQVDCAFAAGVRCWRMRRVRFKARSPGTRKLLEQFQEFPTGRHDDGPDAAEMVLRLAIAWLERDAFDDGLGGRLRISS
ncbi:MAG: hypothetical protein QM811_18800 [Pirellulales bacterium]